ncbi:MAG: PDZ domain-containing protein [Chloroflexi bacterium]|nr:PDZ domain-containing protein [Chloroflexota bacterium]
MKPRLFSLLSVLLIASLACTQLSTSGSGQNGGAPPGAASPTPITDPGQPVQGGADEPVVVTGTIPFTSPFFLDGNAEPFVLLEDQTGFITRDLHYEFPKPSQSIGPVELIDDQTLSFTLPLPAVPQATLHDLDNDGQEDKGVMVFQVAYWSNTWGDAFLEKRDGTGWSGAYTSALTDPDRDYEINGGHLVIWAPDNQQGFPSGFGPDAMLFTEDDPIQAVPAGYSIVDLNSEPFRVYKEANPVFELIEGGGAVKDYSELKRVEAFDAMFEKVSKEYPFTAEKGVDWDALYAEFKPQVEAAKNNTAYYEVLKAFTLAIPDAHIGITFDANVFYECCGGSVGLVLKELSDGRVIVTEVISGSTGDREGIEPGAEIIAWNGAPIAQAISETVSQLGPYSTSWHARLDQVQMVTRVPPDSEVTVTYKNPSGAQKTATLTAPQEYDSLFAHLYYFNTDPTALPIHAYTMDNGVAYMQITTFSDDYNLMARTFERYIQNLIDNNVPSLIIDIRENGGGSGGLAMAFAEYFIQDEVEVAQHAYYNDLLGEFEYGEFPTKLEPAPLYYPGKVVLLVGPNCVSACEGFAYYMTFSDRVTVVGHAPTAGAFGEVGQGQYTLPGDYDMQFPTGRPETMDGGLLIEGIGIVPDITVPVTFDSVMGLVDAVLEAALKVLGK